ncbi:MAG TPA: transglycosylase family protein, partial [Acidimicrobiales bacterium]|nr:transglycosylase family protein [Acidimicrobiales bacterium]
EANVGTAALATPTGAPYLVRTGPDGGDVRLANLAADLHYHQVAAFLLAAKANADARARAQAARSRANQARHSSNRMAGTSTGHACGGDLPPCCVMIRESHGNPTAVNSSSGASGKWQFMPGTWNNYGGYSSAAQAPESVQDARARQVYAGGAGAGNWAGPGC